MSAGWRVLVAEPARPALEACRLCGRPLLGRAWSAEVSGERVDFCEPECEVLFREYWLPRYGSAGLET